jgi:hypothetical protein
MPYVYLRIPCIHSHIVQLTLDHRGGLDSQWSLLFFSVIRTPMFNMKRPTSIWTLLHRTCPMFRDTKQKPEIRAYCHWATLIFGLIPLLLPFFFHYISIFPFSSASLNNSTHILLRIWIIYFPFMCTCRLCVYTCMCLCVYIYIVTWRPKAGIGEPEETFIVRQRLGKHINAATNTQTTIEEMAFLCNGEVNTPL